MITLKKRYYYGIRPLYVGLVVNLHIFNKGWPCSIVEGIGVGNLMISESTYDLIVFLSDVVIRNGCKRIVT